MNQSGAVGLGHCSILAGLSLCLVVTRYDLCWFSLCDLSKYFYIRLFRKHPDPKSGWDLDSDKLGCSASCQGDETNPYFSCAFLTPAHKGWGYSRPHMATFITFSGLKVCSEILNFFCNLKYFC